MIFSQTNKQKGIKRWVLYGPVFKKATINAKCEVRDCYYNRITFTFQKLFVNAEKEAVLNS